MQLAGDSRLAGDVGGGEAGPGEGRGQEGVDGEGQQALEGGGGGDGGAQEGVEREPPVGGQVGAGRGELGNVVDDLAGHHDDHQGGDGTDGVLGQGRYGQAQGA